MSDEVYTYRCGKRIALEKRPDQFVVRALPDELQEMGFSRVTKVSSTSSLVTTTSEKLEVGMSICRRSAQLDTGSHIGRLAAPYHRS